MSEDRYRHSLQDLFAAFADIPGMTIYWGTSGCSLRVQLPGRSPLSIGWFFPPGLTGWMGLKDATFGWYEDVNGLGLNDRARQQLGRYRDRLMALPGAVTPKPASINGAAFAPDVVIAIAPLLGELVREAAVGLVDSLSV
ncbi:MAG TPA: hypothetical protein VHC43_10270 [Mycobacteriales bacterium]|nr:hypothetical protein [Mycobacteriales bacterium]